MAYLAVVGGLIGVKVYKYSLSLQANVATHLLTLAPDECAFISVNDGGYPVLIAAVAGTYDYAANAAIAGFFRSTLSVSVGNARINIASTIDYAVTVKVIVF